MRGIVYGLLFSMILNCAGCLAMKKAYVSIHDSIDEALTNAPAAVTNLTTGAQTPADGNVCGCDMTKPIALPPYTDAGLNAAGNSMECPATKAGAGVVRLWVKKPGGGFWLIGKHLDKGYDIVRPGVAVGKCFPEDGGTWHFIGSTKNDKVIENPIAPGVEFPYSWVTYICFEFRK